MTQRFPVDGSLLFAHAVTPLENYVYCADGMTLLRYDVMTGKKETIVFNAEYFYPVNAGVPCGPDGGFVVRCGESDLAYFASNGKAHPGISQDVAATFSCYLPIDDFAASDKHVFTICSLLLYVYDLKFEQVGEYISNTEIGFQPKFIAVNGEGIVLVTNGTKGAWCDYKAGQEPVFHRVEFPFDVTGLSSFATERFSCHTNDGFQVCFLFASVGLTLCVCAQVVDMEWLEELATCDE